jgi:hypothetical protein
MLQHSKPQTKKAAPVKAKSATTKSAKPDSKSSASEAQTQTFTISSQQRQQMINEAAYYLAEHRGFSGGNPVDDWLAAEAEVDKQLSMGGR